MGIRGPKPQPTALKIARGNPGKRKLNNREPVPPEGIVSPPDWLSDVARKHWFKHAAKLQKMHVLTPIDDMAFGAGCHLYARMMESMGEAQKRRVIQVGENGYEQASAWETIHRKDVADYLKWCAEFGMTPSSRSRLTVADASGGGDEFDRL